MKIRGMAELVRKLPRDVEKMEANKIVARHVGVDAGMIMVCDLSYLETCPSPDVSELNRLGRTYAVPNGKYIVSWKIEETWMGEISGTEEILITSEKLIIVDPCYVIGREKHEDWLKWLDDNRKDKDNCNSYIEIKSTKGFIIQEMRGNGIFKVELEFEKSI